MTAVNLAMLVLIQQRSFANGIKTVKKQGEKMGRAQFILCLN